MSLDAMGLAMPSMPFRSIVQAQFEKHFVASFDVVSTFNCMPNVAFDYRHRIKLNSLSSHQSIVQLFAMERCLGNAYYEIRYIKL